MGRSWKGNFIENPQRYDAAIEARIKANRAKGGRLKWYAAYEDAEELHHWMMNQGEFAPKLALGLKCCQYADGVIEHYEAANDSFYGQNCGCKMVKHPLAFYAEGGVFLSAMRKQIDEWGGLSEKQHVAVQKIYADAKDKLAGRAAAIAEAKEADKAAGFVGEVGERKIFELIMERHFEFASQFGAVFINIMRDADQNIFVYKGGKLLAQRGEAVKIKASIKAQEIREGIKQNIIARPAAA